MAPGGFSSTFKQTCSFDRQAFRGTCTNEYSDSRGTSNGSTTFVTTYASIGEFLDEVRVVPPLFKALKSNATTTGPAGRTSETTYTYDSQGRLTKEATAGAPTSTTYTEWDKAGRPTKVQDVGRGFNNTRDVSFDDVQRTRTTRVTPAGRGQVVMTTIETFDADGNPIRQVATAGPSTTTTTITINSTQRICR
jgi:YD repeat-containing protein